MTAIETMLSQGNIPSPVVQRLVKEHIHINALARNRSLTEPDIEALWDTDIENSARVALCDKAGSKIPNPVLRDRLVADIIADPDLATYKALTDFYAGTGIEFSVTELVAALRHNAEVELLLLAKAESGALDISEIWDSLSLSLQCEWLRFHPESPLELLETVLQPRTSYRLGFTEMMLRRYPDSRTLRVDNAKTLVESPYMGTTEQQMTFISDLGDDVWDLIETICANPTFELSVLTHLRELSADGSYEEALLDSEIFDRSLDGRHLIDRILDGAVTATGLDLFMWAWYLVEWCHANSWTLSTDEAEIVFRALVSRMGRELVIEGDYEKLTSQLRVVAPPSFAERTVKGVALHDCRWTPEKPAFKLPRIPNSEPVYGSLAGSPVRKCYAPRLAVGLTEAFGDDADAWMTFIRIVAASPDITFGHAIAGTKLIESAA